MIFTIKKVRIIVLSRKDQSLLRPAGRENLAPQTPLSLFDAPLSQILLHSAAGCTSPEMTAYGKINTTDETMNDTN